MSNSKRIILIFVALAVFFIFKYISNNNVKIFIVYYKPAPLIKTDIFEPIQGGRAISNTPSRAGNFSKEDISWLTQNMIGDNTSNNISELNRYFAELTAFYWIWKNTNTPIVGMFHYRRLLNLNPNSKYPIIEFPSMRFYHLGINHLEGFSNKFVSDLMLNKQNIQKELKTHDIIISEPIKIVPYEQYQKEHIISDLDDALNLIKKQYPHMHDFAIKTLNSPEGFYPTNMFITKREILNDYAQWLFSILLPLYNNKKDEISTRNTEQKLAFAYLSERLFTIYFKYQQQYNNLKIKEVPFALASNFFTPPPKSAYIILKTPIWKDVFIHQKDDFICGFNNKYRHCGQYTFLPQNKLKIKWDNNDISIFKNTQANEFILEK